MTNLNDQFREAGEEYARRLEQRDHDRQNPAQAAQRNADTFAQMLAEQLNNHGAQSIQLDGHDH